MDIINQLKAFVATAQTGSFTAAADQIGISNRLTSKYVAELEASLGVRLFQRTTRRVGLTAVGESLLAKASVLLDDLDEMLADITDNARDFSGVIRVSAPVTFGELYIVDMLDRFAQHHPSLRFDIRLSDQYVDLAKDGIDLAFRLGRIEMQSLKIRRLASFRSVPVASPDYIKDNGVPTSPADLAFHSCIVDTNRRASDRWVFEQHGKKIEVNVRGKFQVNSAGAVIKLCMNGLGIAYVPGFALGNSIEKGELVTLLEGFQGEEVLLHAIYLEGKELSRKVRALIDFAVQDIKLLEVGCK